MLILGLNLAFKLTDLRQVDFCWVSSWQRENDVQLMLKRLTVLHFQAAKNFQLKIGITCHLFPWGHVGTALSNLICFLQCCRSAPATSPLLLRLVDSRLWRFIWDTPASGWCRTACGHCATCLMLEPKWWVFNAQNSLSIWLIEWNNFRKPIFLNIQLLCWSALLLS